MSIQVTFDHYYNYQEMTDILQMLQSKYPHLMNLYSLGKSTEGRDIWAIEITNTTTGGYADKPAYYIDGNHHAGEVTGSMATMYAIHYLLTTASEKVQYLLDNFTFYMIPRVSPDGAETYLTTPHHLRSVNRPYPYGDLMPGLQPKDINGDGEILLMRIPSLYGGWKVSDKDPRLMIKRAPDDRGGKYYHVVTEGELIEYDGLEIMAAPEKWGLDFNRNYPNCWFPEYRQPGAGPYPLSNAENKMVADFVLAHPNIGSAVTNHTTGGVFVYPPGTKPSKEGEPQDVAMFKAVGKMATDETGYVNVNIFDEFLADVVNFSSGAFDDWMYGHQGIPAYTSELWDLQIRAGVTVWPRRPKDDDTVAEDNLKVLQWCDANLGEGHFMNWTAFEHPQLGPVDIGGILFKFVHQNCPPAFLEQECAKINNFYLRHATTLPKVQITKAEAIKQDESTWKLVLEVVNDGYLPTYLTQEALNIKVDKPIEVTLDVPADTKIIMGKANQSIGHLEGFSQLNSDYQFGNIRMKQKNPGMKRVEWVVQGTAGQKIDIFVHSQKAGKAKAGLVLQ